MGAADKEVSLEDVCSRWGGRRREKAVRLTPRSRLGVLVAKSCIRLRNLQAFWRYDRTCHPNVTQNSIRNALPFRLFEIMIHPLSTDILHPLPPTPHFPHPNPLYPLNLNSSFIHTYLSSSNPLPSCLATPFFQ
jgi:hypothetical protein